jgi:hypothetical protein
MSGPAWPPHGIGLVLATTGLLLVACSTTRVPVQTTITPIDEPFPTSATAVTGTSALSPGGDAVLVASALAAELVVRPSDLPSPWAGMQLRLPTDGDKLTVGSLDNCGYRFVTEKFRLARRQVAVVDAAGRDVGVSHEVIVYASPAHASEAFREWRSSVNGCRKGTVFRSPVPGSPRIRLDAASTAADSTLPVAQNLVTRTSATILSASRPRLHGITLLQLQGTVLDVVRVRSATPLTVSKIKAGVALAAAAGHRLAEG